MWVVQVRLSCHVSESFGLDTKTLHQQCSHYFPSLTYSCPSYLESFRCIISLLLTLSWFVMGCLWEFSYVVCGDFFKHIWSTFLIGDSNPDNLSCLILSFHNGAYNDSRCASLCDLQFFLSIFDSFYLQLSHHYVHIFTVIYSNSLLLFGHYSFVACKAIGCFRSSHWVSFQQ